MIRRIIMCAALVACVSSAVFAQQEGVTVHGDQSGLEQGWLGDLRLELSLSAPVAFRVYTLDQPPRLVVDLEGASWTGRPVESLIQETDLIENARFGAIDQQWSRLVADLSMPALPYEIAMAPDVDGGAVLSMTLKQTTLDVFTAAAGAPPSAQWTTGKPQPFVGRSDDRFVVVLDPGHGGIDPGAERQGISEKELMLAFAREVRKKLQKSNGVDVVMTRDADVFVSLQNRVAQAHQAGADLFLSLHADALSQGGAKGATIYTLSQEASDAASAQLAARHNRADVLAGLDLTGSDDEVTGVLLDLARQETEPRSHAYARSLVQALSDAGGPVNNRPLRSAGFTVLKSADIPSVLLEVGFLSSERDLKNLRNPVWRDGVAQAIVASIENWRRADEARRALLRQ